MHINILKFLIIGFSLFRSPHPQPRPLASRNFYCPWTKKNFDKVDLKIESAYGLRKLSAFKPCYVKLKISNLINNVRRTVRAQFQRTADLPKRSWHLLCWKFTNMTLSQINVLRFRVLQFYALKEPRSWCSSALCRLQVPPRKTSVLCERHLSFRAVSWINRLRATKWYKQKWLTERL
jgi:hypothetical protein